MNDKTINKIINIYFILYIVYIIIVLRHWVSVASLDFKVTFLKNILNICGILYTFSWSDCSTLDKLRLVIGAL